MLLMDKESATLSLLNKVFNSIQYIYAQAELLIFSAWLSLFYYYNGTYALMKKFPIRRFKYHNDKPLFTVQSPSFRELFFCKFFHLFSQPCVNIPCSIPLLRLANQLLLSASLNAFQCILAVASERRNPTLPPLRPESPEGSNFYLAK